MGDVALAAVLIVAFTISRHWAFRCQRVGRGIILLARDTAPFVKRGRIAVPPKAGHPRLFSAIMPSRYVSAIWFGWLLWRAGAFFAWRAGRWYGLLALLLYGLFWNLSTWADKASPWPSYFRLLDLFKTRIHALLAAGTEVPGVGLVLVVATITKIEEQMRAGSHFEKVTTEVWFDRAATKLQAAQQARRLSAD